MSQGYDAPRWEDEDAPRLGDESAESQEGSTADAGEPEAPETTEAPPPTAVDLDDPWERAARATRAADTDEATGDEVAAVQAEADAEVEAAPALPEAEVSDDDAADVDRSSENVLAAWPEPGDPEPAGGGAYGSDAPLEQSVHGSATDGWTPSPPADDDEPAAIEVAEESVEEPVDDDAPVDAVIEEDEALPLPELGSTTAEHAPGELLVPPGVPLLEGVPRGERRAVGIVVSRFNGEVTTKLLEGALNELTDRGVAPEAVTVMPVPGAFELPLAAMALAKTRRFSCVVALGCVIRGDTPHFDYVSSETASGLQLAAIETGVPVAFGVLTLDRVEQAEARLDKGAEAVRSGLEMADIFANLRAAAAR